MRDRQAPGSRPANARFQHASLQQARRQARQLDWQRRARAGFLLAVLAAVAACDGPPWEKTESFPFQIEVHIGGTPVSLSDLQTGNDGLRLVHRVDVFRPRNLYPRGHEASADCVLRYRDGRLDLPPSCTALDGNQAVGADAGAGAVLDENQAVLSTLLASSPVVPRFAEAPADPFPLRGDVTIDARERYWARFWSSCDGCLGLAWIEARWRGKRYCTRAARMETDVVVFDVDLAETGSPRRVRDAIEDERDRPLCGDLSWFEAFSKERSSRFRP